MVGKTGKMDAGIFEYGSQWVRDGSNVALGLIYSGHFESARTLLNFILTDLVSDDGATVISGGFDGSDREELDQMGELIHALKVHRDWTGDSTLIAGFRTKIIAMVERPLHPRFRDSTGMVHSRREYWERTFSDAYELAYQTFMIRGLIDAADVSGILGVPDRAQYWREQADIILRAMVSRSPTSLVDQGALIKRRNVDSSVADFVPGPSPSYKKDDPYATEAFHRLNPDASYALPIFLHVIEPHSELSRRTLDKLEKIWNARWNLGGYDRYHSSSQQDQPGPWTFATASIARAQHDAGLLERSRRSLEWLSNIQGGNAGAWFEEIPLIRSQMPTSGIVPWTSAEVVIFAVRHWLGLHFDGNDLVIRPNLFPHEGNCKADVRFRSSRIRLEIDRPGEAGYALINGTKVLPWPDGAIRVPAAMLAGSLDITLFAK
jgi:GH15 family glucan-1,4-alpha-glucosidase